MQKPDVKITKVTFTEEQKIYPSPKTEIICSVHYEMATENKTYTDLCVTGDAENHPDGLRNALNNLDWDVYLDAIFTDDEVTVLKMAYQLFKGDSADGWETDATLAHRTQVQIQPHVESNLIYMLAKNRLLDRHDAAYGITFRISDLGRFIVETHRQFKSSTQ